ncbi:MAG: lactate utilization protein [Bacteroidetes bacterium]|nr:lactate utilization protein [Bacteroidota bacterium]
MEPSKTIDHAALAAEFNKDPERVDWHDATLWTVRQRRDMRAHQVPEWEALREMASQIKENVLSNLHSYLQQFEQNAIANGITVHWAEGAEDHNQIIYGILKAKGINQMVKSKSMLTEECGLNEFLGSKGIDVVDSDLGERIIQLAHQRPTHIVLPAIHLRKEEIGEIFHEHLGTPKGLSDPQELTETARQHLREVFLTRRAALTGVNFGIAETGEFVVCTNEGNADMGAHLSEVHIASMGLEKLVPTRQHMGIFLRLLARSATGQPITTYSSHFSVPRPGQEMHIVLVDKGRTRQLGRPDFRASLKCIKCAACMNTCPVYRRSGGYSYQATIAGPIGSILTPNLDMDKYKNLPFASTLCGSCTNVCPVKIDIHQQLFKWRQEIIKEGKGSAQKTFSMKLMASILSSPGKYKLSGSAFKWVSKWMPFLVKNKMNPWYRQRDMPQAPATSFKEWYKKNV